MKSTRRVVELMWPQDAYGITTADGRSDAPDICSATLRRMETLGDVVDTGRGQWIATPLRIVAPENAESCLLVGTAPVPAASQITGAKVICAGATRFLDKQAIRAHDSGEIAQSIDMWLGEMPPLAEWTARILAAHEARMEVMQDVSAEQLEIYAPDVLRSQRRTGRWVAAAQVGRSLDGLRLCQPQGRYARSYDTPQYLAHFEFRDGVPSLRRCVSIKRELTLRLRFGLDNLLKTPRELSIVHAGQTFTIDRPLALPQPEERLYALGWEDRTVSELPDRLVFHLDALPIVLHALRRLSISPSIRPRNFS